MDLNEAGAVEIEKVETKNGDNGDGGEFRQLLKEWLRVSKTHGLDRIVISRNLFWQIIWLVGVLASASGCFYLISSIISTYLQYEVKTHIREVYVDKVPFPTVSICNYNQMVTPEANDYISEYFKV